MKRISPYLGLYRTMFIVAIIVSLAYATFNFVTYQEAMRTFVTNENPSFIIKRELYYRNQNYEAAKQTLENLENGENVAPEKLVELKKSATIVTPESLRDELFQISSLAPTDDLDELWLGGIYARVIGTTITFTFAVATIILALFALNHKKTAAIISTVGIFLIFLSNQLTLFVSIGMYGISTYERYFFNFLELIFILTFIGLILFTIFVNPEFKTKK